MSLTWCESVGWSGILGYWTTDVREDGVDISVSAPGTSFDLIPVSADQGHTALPATLLQRYTVGGANAIQGVVATPGVFGMAVVNTTQGHTVAAPTQVQQYTLGAANATQSHTSTPAVIGLNVGAPTMGHSVAAPTIQMFAVFGVANAVVECNASPVVMSKHVLAANAITECNAGAPELFSLTNIGDRQLWLSPESGVVVTATNRITTWTGKAGSQNATNVRLSSMPFHVSAVQNGFNVVEFRTNPPDGRLFATNVAAGSALSQSGASPYSFGWVGKVSAASGGQRLFQWGVTSGTTTQLHTVQVSSNYHVRDAGNNATNSSARTFGSVPTTPMVLRGVYSNGNISMWQNGVNIANALKVSGIGNKAVGAAPMILIGGDGTTNPASTFNGWVAEFIVTTSVLSSSEGREMDKLLGAKYGITIT